MHSKIRNHYPVKSLLRRVRQRRDLTGRVRNRHSGGTASCRVCSHIAHTSLKSKIPFALSGYISCARVLYHLVEYGPGKMYNLEPLSDRKIL